MNSKINPICYLPMNDYVKAIEAKVNELNREEEKIDFRELEIKQRERDKGAYQFVKVFKDIQ